MRHKTKLFAFFCTIVIIISMTPTITAQEPFTKPPRKTIPSPPTTPRLIEQETAAERFNQSREADESALRIFQTVENSEGTIDDSNLAENGNVLTYTIRIKNVSELTISTLTIFDVIPRNALDRNNITCITTSSISSGKVSDCTIEKDAIYGSDGQANIFLPREISWSLQDSLAPNEEIVIAFSGQLICQNDGNIIENGVFINYQTDGIPFVNDSDLMQKTVIAGEAAIGQFKLVGPTWCAFGGEVGLDLAWGDFDEDGDLDLALATIYGAIVYQNNDGQLEEYWNNSQYTQSVQWVDAIIDNGSLELITVGDSESTDPFQGINYVYRVSGSGFVEVGDTPIPFDDFRRSDAALWRVAAADYDGDGDMDLATIRQTGSTNACLIRLYENDGSGQFFNDGCFANVNPAFNYADSFQWVDYDNDLDPDLAVTFSYYDDVTFDEIGYLYVLINQNGRLTDNQVIAQGLASTLYDLTWGDYDHNGWFDVALPLYATGELNVYSNQGVTNGSLYPSFSTPIVITNSENTKPSMLDWADMDQDNNLELVVASDDGHVSIYKADSDYQSFSLLSHNNSGQKYTTFWTIRTADVDGDGDLEIAVANEGQSIMFLNFGRGLSTIPSTNITKYYNGCTERSCYAASSISWGDIDGDLYVDAMLGSSIDSGALDTKIHRNNGGVFDHQPRVEFSGLGPRAVAFGDVDNDYLLDMAIVDGDRALIYLASDTINPLAQLNNNHNASVEWGDYNDDGNLELLFGRASGGNQLYRLDENNELELIWANGSNYRTIDVAWGDFNRDRYLDFAVANYDGPTQVFCNNRAGGFKLAWESTLVYSTSSVAWADYDSDGDLDLAEGNMNGRNRILENRLCDTKSCNQKLPFELTEVSCSDEIDFLAARLNDLPKSNASPIIPVRLAWGDIDNDGDMDLAVANNGEPDFIYNITQNAKGNILFDVNWVSQNSYETSDISWGDVDNDGDLDLAVTGLDERNVIYGNNYISHQEYLPNNPPYVFITRPGNTRNGYGYSVGNEILSGAPSPTVTIRYWVKDPDGDGVTNTTFEYSLTDGGAWFTATPASTPTTVITPSQLGQELTFLWDAQADKAISDKARFRITIPSHIGRVSADDTSTYQHGYNKYGTIRAISPPFRVRGLTCVWPKNPSFTWSHGSNSLGQEEVPLDTTVEFVGKVDLASQGLTFYWEFSDGHTYTGQVIRRSFSLDNKYLVNLTVTSESCPIAKMVDTYTWLTAGTGIPNNYIPFLFRNSYSGVASNRAEKEMTTSSLSTDTLPQIDDLHGETTKQSTTLTWSAPETTMPVTGYHVYRATQQAGQFSRIATLPLDTPTYTDSDFTCGQSYYVTLYNDTTESLASTTSYFSLPCKP